MKGKIINSILFGLILIALSLPFLQQHLDLFIEKPLQGYFEKSASAKISLKSWMNGEFQDNFTNSFNDELGFKSGLTRVYNQLNYSLFQQTNVQQVELGKNGYLFEDNYIEAYLGNNYIGLDRIRSRMDKLQALQDTLQKQGKNLLIVIAPNKARFFPEYLPEEYDDNTIKLSNYGVVLNGLIKNKINHIDFNSWFLKQKESSTYPLYPQCGIHWSVYGVTLAADSIIKYLNGNMNYHLPEMKWDEINLSSDYKYPDYDIADAMNLLWPITEEKLAYPEVSFQQTENTRKPRCMVHGDSYYNSFIYESYQSEMFELGGFWYYNDKVYRSNMNESVDVETLDFAAEIENTELFIFMYTEPNIHDIGFGFVEKMHKYFRLQLSQEEREYMLLVDKQVGYIKDDETWMKAIREKAAAEGRDLETQIRLDAEWAVNERLSKQENE